MVSRYVQMASGLGAIRFLTNIFLHYYPLLPFLPPPLSLPPSLHLSLPPFSSPPFSFCTLAAANFSPAYLATHPDTSSPTPRRPASCFSRFAAKYSHFFTQKGASTVRGQEEPVQPIQSGTTGRIAPLSSTSAWKGGGTAKHHPLSRDEKLWEADHSWIDRCPADCTHAALSPPASLRQNLFIPLNFFQLFYLVLSSH